ncbi:SDR family oxidoreductase [Pararhodobacter sp. SW119]|uniref:SDR family oxidoreductase n=1 Tax=Pararhodobacter sp. SW119 TaxID=2780075 RepID=UPI001AE0B586|nr:SDR family oxidoreductase [Pararhodobacter sp. SW119]
MTIEGATIVTGSSRGIGLAIARQLVAQGHEVVGIARSQPGPEGFTTYAADLTDAAQTEAVLAEVVKRHRVLRLVNNAGVSELASLEAATAAQLDLLVAVHLRAPMQAMQAVLPGMRAAGFGRIVNIGSRAALGKPGRLLYGATKAGLASMTRTAALELAADGITVNCIAPGPIETELFAAGNPPDSEARRRFTAGIPVARVGTPEEIAHACGYFLDARAGFTTGQLLHVCGGMSIGATLT